MTGALLKVRASTLAGWPDCERRGATKVLRAEIEAAGYTLRGERRNIGAIIGTAVHFSAKEVLSEKMNGRTAPASFAADAAITSLRTATDVTEINFDKETVDANDAERVAKRMALTFRTHVVPMVEPIAVEERLEADAGNGLILSGQSDLVAIEPYRVVDLKTGKRRGHYKPQLGAYTLLNRSHGRPITKALETFVQRVPFGKPQPDPITVEHNLADAETAAANVIERIGQTVARFRATKDPWSFMANPSSMLCSAKFCPAHGTEFCREHMDRLS